MPPAWRFEAIGTVWSIHADQAIDEPLRRRIEEIIAGFDREWSRFREDSLVSALARAGGDVVAPADATAMLDTYARLSEATGGAVNPLVGESMSRLGYDATYSLRAGEPTPAPRRWRETLRWDDGMLRLQERAMIDVGAVGKGRLVDLVLQELVSAGLTGPVVDAGGDIAARGRPVRVGLEHPFDASRAIGVLTIQDEALCASATNRRAWGDGLHHVIDARTGMPVRTIAATWAVGADALQADAAATALFFDGGPQLAAEWGIDWVRMTTDGRVEWAPASRVELFS